jgi:hypothetical protein
MGSDLQNLNNLVLIYFFLLGVGLDVESFKKLINLIVLNSSFQNPISYFCAPAYSNYSSFASFASLTPKT